MKTFLVRMPFTGVASRYIQAETEEEAAEVFERDTTFPTMRADSETDAEIEEWEFHEHIVQGNVFYGVMNEMEVTDETPDEG